MKRFFTAIIAILFLVSATGTTVNLHYCMGKLVSASHHLPQSKHKCAQCGMTVDSKKNNGCCKDESKTFKSSEHQKSVCIDFLSTVKMQQATLPFYFTYAQSILTVQANKQLFLAHAPPERQLDCPIYLAVRNFRV